MLTSNEKLNRAKTLLGDDAPPDELLEVYLDMAADEIMSWLYIRSGSVPDGALFPAMYDQVQIMAVVTAVNLMGAEGETVHIENGTHRHFKYDDMVAYIRTHVYPYVVVL